MTTLHEARPVTLDRIIDTVCEYYSVRRRALLSPSRLQYLVEPRWCCMYLARTLTGYSLECIANALGRADHTTVLHGLRELKSRGETDDVLASRLRYLKERVQA